MARTDVCWGLDIGSAGVKAVKLQADGDSVKVMDFAVVPYPKVLSTPGIDATDVIRIGLGAFTSQYDISGAQVAVSVPGHQALARFAKLPPVEPKKVKDIVKFEADQQIPFPLEEVEWDYQTFVSPDSPEIEVGIFAITNEKLNERLRLFEDIGLVPDLVTLNPLAVYNTLAYDLTFTEDTPGTIIVDVGNVSTDVIIADAGRVWIRTIPMGGHSFTEALVDQFKLSYSKAEKLKCEAEQSKHARHVFQAMRPVFSDLAQEIQRSLGYYASLHPDANLERLIGLGSTFQLPGLRKYLKQQLEVDVYRVEKFKRLEIPEGQESAVNDASLVLGTATGLALQGLGLATLEANLMPVRLIRENMWARKTPWFGIAAGVAAAASAVLFVRPFLDSSAADSEPEPPALASMERQSRQLSAEAEELGVAGDASPDLRGARLLSIGGDQKLYSDLLADFGAMLANANSYARNNGYPGGRPALTLESIEHTFMEPSAQQPTTGRGSRGGDEEAPAGGGSIESQRRVEITLTMRSAFASTDMVENAIVGWINENAQREGVPYTFADRVIWDFIQMGEGEQRGMRSPRNPGAGRDTRSTGGGRSPIIDSPIIDDSGFSNPGRGMTGRTGRTGRSGGDLDLNRMAPVEMPELTPRDYGVVTVSWFAILNAGQGDES
jgi:type IV pilus assembly protein PilM